MRLRLALLLAIAGAVAAIPAPAAACGCGGTASLSAAYEAADLVFVGTVVRSQRTKSWRQENADGSISGGIEPIPGTAVFTVDRVFRGQSIDRLTIVGDGAACNVPFEPGQRWLVYAHVAGGRASTSICSRTRLREAAGQDIGYLDGRSRGRAQGVVFGEILRRVPGAGELSAGPPFQSLTIIAAGHAGRTEVAVSRWGAYDLVLPPGDFDVWVERDGRVVANRTPVSVTDRSEHRLVLLVEDE